MRLVKFGPCKLRNFIIILFSAVITLLTFCAFNREQPVDLQSLISDTTKHLEQLKQNLQAVTKEKRFEVEDNLLVRLGFRQEFDNSSNLKQSSQTVPRNGSVRKQHANGSLPVIVASAVSVKQLEEVPGFLSNIHSFIPSLNGIVLWSLEKESEGGSDTDFSLNLKQLCNSTKCHVESFKFTEYPMHVGELQLSAYRPLIIQMMLEQNGCVLWLDIDRRIVPRAKDHLGEFVFMALHGGSHGIVGWSAGRPTSSMTHPKTFSYFQTEAENYYFHRMIDPAQLLICNTKFVHNSIMLPWVECTLTKDCINPFGAQSSGCRFDKKPLYRYSGCHGYDSSALNVALGIAFPLHQPYISRAVLAQPAQQTHQNETSRRVTFS